MRIISGLASRSEAAQMTGPSIFPGLPGSAVESNVGGFASYAAERFSHLNQLAGVTRGWENTDNVVGNRLIDTIADLEVLSQIEFAGAPTFLSFEAGCRYFLFVCNWSVHGLFSSVC
jgi:hypothetical protein